MKLRELGFKLVEVGGEREGFVGGGILLGLVGLFLLGGVRLLVVGVLGI